MRIKCCLTCLHKGKIIDKDKELLECKERNLIRRIYEQCGAHDWEIEEE